MQHYDVVINIAGTISRFSKKIFIELQFRFWLNDDNNGYVDDVFGWNFLGNKEGKIVNTDQLEITRIVKKGKEKFGDKYPVPTRNAPKFLIWILAPFIGIKRNFVSKNVGYKIDFDNRKSIKELGINYSPVKGEKHVLPFVW